MESWRSRQKAPLQPRERKRTICSPEHKHDASSTCYIQHQCRCDACCTAHNARDQKRKKLKAYGRFDTGLVDAAPVRAHLLMLGEHGLGYKRVAKLAGLGITPVRNILWGRQDPGPRKGEISKRVRRETAERILAVLPSLDNLAGGQLVTALGAQRRLQALVKRGWSLSKLATRLGMLPSNIGTLMSGDRVTVATHRAVADLFTELWDQAPPENTHHDKVAATKARKYATARRWVPPLAWDDIDNDEAPNTGIDEGNVDEIAVSLAVDGESVKLTGEERRAAVMELHKLRYSDSVIAGRLQIADRTVLRIREELGFPAWTKTEQRKAA